MVSATKLYFTKLDSFKPEVEQFLSEKLHKKVNISKLNFSWPSQGPQLEIQEITVETHPEHSLQSLEVKRSLISLSVWKSILYRQLVTNNIEFQGIRVKVNQKKSNLPNQSLDIAKTTTRSKKNIIGDWLIAQRTIKVYDLILELAAIDGTDQSLSMPILNFHGSRSRQQLRTSLVSQSGATASLKIENRIHFSEKEQKNINATQLYFSSDKMELATLPFALFGLKLPPLKGQLNIKFWADWKQGRLQTAQAELHSNTMQLGENAVALTLSPTIFLWKRHQKNHWSLLSSPIEFTLDKKIQPPFQLNAHQWKKDHIKHYMFTGFHFDIEKIAQFVEPLLPKKLHAWLLAAKPQGEISKSSINILRNTEDPTQPIQYFTRFSLEKISVNPFQNLPGIQGVNARVSLSSNQGKVELLGKDGNIEIPSLFRSNIFFNQLSTHIDWHWNNNLQLTWHDFDFSNPDISISSRGRLDFLKNGNGFMDISASINHASMNSISPYLPTGIMSEKLVEYLDNSIQKGQLNWAQAVIRGPMKSFPYHQHEGIFDILSEIQGVKLQFLPDWPTIDNLKASMEFVSNSMNIHASQGKFKGVTLKSATAEIADFSQHHLEIATKTQSQTAIALQALESTPINFIPESLKNFTFKGLVTSSLHLSIPLSKEQQTLSLKGEIKLKDNQVELLPASIPFDNVNASLTLNETGLLHSTINATLWQQPFQMVMQPDTENRTLLTGSFQTTIDHQALDQLSHLTTEAIAIGQTQMLGDILIATAPSALQPLIEMNFHSNMQGLALHLPESLGKDETEIIPLDIHLELQDEKLKINAQYHGKLHLIAEKTQQWKGGFSSIELPIESPESNGWIGNVHQTGFQLSDWVKAYNEITANKQPSKTQDYNELLPLQLKVTSEQLMLNQWLLGPVSILADFNHQLQVSVQGPQIQAKIQANPPSAQNFPLSLNFDRLFIRTPEEEKKLNEVQNQVIIQQEDNQLTAEKTIHLVQERQDLTSTVALSPFKPKVLPSMHIICEDCRYNDQRIGQLDLKTMPFHDKMAYWGHWFVPEIFDTEFTGQWTEKVTQFAGQFSSKNIETLTHYWNIASGAKKSAIQASYTLNWPGAPWDFQLDHVRGTLNAKVNKGSLEQIDTKGAQIVGIFSLQNLLRRLSLDFSDIFNKGFYYNGMEASVNIEDGIAYNSSVKISGTAATIEISGYTDLAQERLEHHIVVIPEISSSLPILGWAISPATGLIALVMDKFLLKPALDVVTRLDYQLTGVWSSPELIELNKKQDSVPVDIEKLKPALKNEDNLPTTITNE